MYLTPNRLGILSSFILYAISGGLLEVMATSYSSFSRFLGAPHGAWKEGEKDSYTFTPPCPS